MAKNRTTKNPHSLKKPTAFDVPATPPPDAQSVASVQASTSPAPVTPAPAAPAPVSGTPATAVATSSAPTVASAPPATVSPTSLPPTPSVFPDFLSTNVAVKQAMGLAGTLTILSPAEKKLYAKMMVGGEPYINSMAQIAIEQPDLVPGRIDPQRMVERLESVQDATKLQLTLQQALAGVDDYILQLLSADWRDALVVYNNAKSYVVSNNDQSIALAIADMETFVSKGSRTRAKNKKAAAAAGATGSSTGSTTTTAPSSSSSTSSSTTTATPSTPSSTPPSTSNPTPTANGGVAPSGTAPSVTGSGTVPVYTPSTKG